MKLSEFIQRLEVIKKTSGDVEVVSENSITVDVALITDEDTGEDTVVVY